MHYLSWRRRIPIFRGQQWSGHAYGVPARGDAQLGEDRGDVMVHRLRRDVQPGSHVDVRRSSASSRSTSISRSVSRPGLASVVRRGRRVSLRTPRSRRVRVSASTAGHAPSRSNSARAATRSSVAPDWASDIAASYWHPRSCPGPRAVGRVEGVRARGAGRRRGDRAAFFQPEPELADRPRLTEPDGQPEGSLDQPGDRRLLPGEPRRFGPSGGDRPEPLEVAGLERESPGLLERRLGVRVAAAGAQSTEHRQTDDPRRHMRRRLPDNLGGAAGRLRPTTLLELDAGQPRQAVRPDRVDVPLGAERYRLA